VDESVRGHLLIAAPSLFDYFRRTVVLVLEHTPDGAMGVVLGRSSETRVADAVPVLADLADSDDLVYLGGPVSPQSVVALGDFEHPEEAGTQVVGSLGTLDPDGANELL
jgi:putative transcriptional regulator